ncbi:53 kDa excretory [Trichuris trichiura]|uniref:53 kDa excretory n=1 Tax=Trichuris trichiura TaxID=36087 RepID=A0A077ZF13_TRITR|nr:53 kDa excretory [Trichuris trichiura]
MIHQYSNVTLDELILVALCKDTGRTKVIMHMRVHIRNCQKNSPNSCKSGPPISAYCSWIGRLNGTAHRKLDGAVCYITEKISEEEEWTIATIDVCKLWRYADTKYYRLLIPVGIEKWKKQLLLYYPVPTDPSMRQELMKTMGQSHQSEHMNPQGRAGILGQGVLKHLGENLMELPILLRVIAKKYLLKVGAQLYNIMYYML